MPEVINVASTAHCSLADCIEGLDESGFEPADRASIADAALWLRKLGNNRDFLGDILLDQLKSRFREGVVESGYGPQAILLGPLRNGVLLRANIWPGEHDHCYQASGAQSFVYGVPHDHNFSFLTVGYLGPGYHSDYYEYDYSSVAGYPGEHAGLRFIERSTLCRGKLILYRAHRDVHSQIPPASLSVSINIMNVDPMRIWRNQYGFDLEKGEIAQVLSPNATEVFLRVAVASENANALDLAEQFGRHHPSDRMRQASYEARALLCKDAGARDALWRDAELSGNRLLTAVAKQQRKAIATS